MLHSITAICSLNERFCPFWSTVAIGFTPPPPEGGSKTIGRMVIKEHQAIRFPGEAGGPSHHGGSRGGGGVTMTSLRVLVEEQEHVFQNGVDVKQMLLSVSRGSGGSTIRPENGHGPSHAVLGTSFGSLTWGTYCP